MSGLPSDELELAVVDDGLLVRGQAEQIEMLTAELHRGPGRVRVAPQGLFDTLATAAGVAGVAATHATYFKLSAESLAALMAANGGQVPSGLFSGVTRGGAGSILKHLQLSKVDLGPEQALSLQLAAATVALRMAIAEVQKAVERVEGKVDEVVRLIRSERLGDALGDQRTLSRLVDRLEATGKVSLTDWSSVAAMGPAIVRDIEELRAHVRLTVDGEVKAWTGSRLDAAEKMLDEARLRETLALLVLVEQNHNLWQTLRIAHVRQTEPDHLESTLADARAALAGDTESDQALVESLDRVLGTLLRPSGLEGFSPIQAPRLRAAGDDMSEMLTWFADQRLLDRVPVEVEEMPGVKDSAELVVRTAVDGAKTVKGAARDLVRRRPRRGGSAANSVGGPDTADELPVAPGNGPPPGP
jgi:hypothetical protein